MRKRGIQPLFLTLTLTLALAGCTKQPALPPPSEILGPYTATGTVTATGASLYRRGTHVLLMDGLPRFFLESKTIALSEYEGVYAVVQGELFPNTHPSFLPVLQVERVLPRSAAVPPSLQRYEVPALGLSLEAPVSWKSTLSDDRLAFRLPLNGEATEPPVVSPKGSPLGGEVEPFLTVRKAGTTELPEGLPLRIGGRNAVRIVSEATGKHEVYVEVSAGNILLFTFAPADPDTATLRDAFYSLLRSVRFEEEDEEERNSGPLETEEEAGGPVIPCGGPAHVLCPEGMFCEVRELDTGIGACKRLR